jgi:uncharacterized protein YjbI with pentapeptide repeats
MKLLAAGLTAMTVAEHLTVLHQGGAAWNRRRREWPDEAAPDLSGAQFARADLSGFDLHGVGMKRAYLREACLRGASLRQADLRGAYLTGADVERADLSHALLVAANLNGANLSHCVCHGADLREADCGGANLASADLTDARLHGLNLLGANLEGVRLVRTKGLTPRQLMAAVNWEKALFDRELASDLDLPWRQGQQPLVVNEDVPSLDTEAPSRPFRLAPRSLEPFLG